MKKLLLEVGILLFAAFALNDTFGNLIDFCCFVLILAEVEITFNKKYRKEFPRFRGCRYNKP